MIIKYGTLHPRNLHLETNTPVQEFIDGFTIIQSQFLA